MLVQRTDVIAGTLEYVIIKTSMYGSQGGTYCIAEVDILHIIVKWILLIQLRNIIFERSITVGGYDPNTYPYIPFSSFPEHLIGVDIALPSECYT